MRGTLPHPSAPLATNLEAFACQRRMSILDPLRARLRSLWHMRHVAVYLGKSGYSREYAAAASVEYSGLDVTQPPRAATALRRWRVGGASQIRRHNRGTTDNLPETPACAERLHPTSDRISMLSSGTNEASTFRKAATAERHIGRDNASSRDCSVGAERGSKRSQSVPLYQCWTCYGAHTKAIRFRELRGASKQKPGLHVVLSRLCGRISRLKASCF